MGSTTPPGARFSSPDRAFPASPCPRNAKRSSSSCSRDKAEDEFQDSAGRMPALPSIGSAKLLIQAKIILDKVRTSIVILSWCRFGILETGNWKLKLATGKRKSETRNPKLEAAN